MTLKPTRLPTEQPHQTYATRMIGDSLGEDLVTYVRKQLRKKVERNDKPTGTYKGADIYTFGAPGGYGYVVLVEPESKEVLYFVRHHPVKANGHAFGRQVLVWRLKSHPASGGFSHKVFLTLLRQYGKLVTDVLQTEKGRDLWLFALGEALHGSETRFIYFLDRRSSPNTLTQIHNNADLMKHYPLIWGTDKGHERTHAVISLTPLTL